jgi:dihydroorotase
MKKTLILKAKVVNEGLITETNVELEGPYISRIGPDIAPSAEHTIIQAQGKYLFPGLIDDQVHFREPGLTHKGCIRSESRAAVAGGITSYMEMPNTKPSATQQSLLDQKFEIAAKDSLANYSFYAGANGQNTDWLTRLNRNEVCGIKIFMGSSTGDLLVEDQEALRTIFSRNQDLLIATHCESDPLIKENYKQFKAKYGDAILPEHHPLIRNAEACYASSSFAVALAKETGARLHVLHISTEKELALFEKGPLQNKRITAEACIHHLWFSDADYATKGNWIKWNPAVKTAQDRAAIQQAVREDRIDVIATDHAPHTIEEKSNPYESAPSGGPLVQHSLLALLDLYHQGVFDLETIVAKSAHRVADLFQIDRRGYIREGYYADLVLVDLEGKEEVKKENLLYQCGWSPFENHTFRSKIDKTWVSGNLAWNEGKIQEMSSGMALRFNRE